MLVEKLGMQWLTPSYFVKGWPFFFKEELLRISILFGAGVVTSFIVDIFGIISWWHLLIIVILFRRIMAGGICTSDKRLDGQVIIVTGSNTGIGKETVRDLSSRGAEVIMACRDMRKAEKAATDLKVESPNRLIIPMLLDLASLSSVRAFSEKVKSKYNRIDCLINNAGVMMCSYSKTEDNFEMQIGVNHFGHFLLTNLLLPLLRKAASARIINVSSLLHWTATKIPFEDFSVSKDYDKYIAYGNSKLANVLFTRQLAKRLQGTKMQSFSLHPGVVQTEIGRHMGLGINIFYENVMSLFQKSVKEGAQTTIYCATEATQHSLVHFSDCAVGNPSPSARDEKVAEKLWEVSEELVGIKFIKVQIIY